MSIFNMVLKCMDKATMDRVDIKYIALNTKCYSQLLMKCFVSGDRSTTAGSATFMGFRLTIDDGLPDGAVKINDVIYGVEQPEIVSSYVGPDTAIIAFMGWLTTRSEVSGPFSFHHDANQANELVKEFCEVQGWNTSGAIFHRQLEQIKKMPNKHQPQLQGVSPLARPASRMKPQPRTARDSQFAGFAKLLLNDLMQTNALDKVDVGRFWDEEDRAEVEKVIAQRAYDLVEHALESCLLSERAYSLVRHFYNGNIESVEIERHFNRSELLEDIPDMTEYPKEE